MDWPKLLKSREGQADKQEPVTEINPVSQECTSLFEGNKINWLTIAIPTFDRAEKLSVCLDRIENEGRIEGVEVLVSDNDSSDNTKAVVTSRMQTFPIPLKYRRNERNLGFDANIKALYKDASSRYVWFLSDDDMVLPGSILRIRTVLEKEMPTVLYANLESDKLNEPVIKGGQVVDITPYLPSGIAACVKTGKKFAVRDNVTRLVVVRLMSFISCHVVQRDPKIVDSLCDFLGTGIIQDAIAPLLLRGGQGSAYLMQIPSVRGGNKSSFSNWFMESTMFWGGCYV